MLLSNLRISPFLSPETKDKLFDIALMTNFLSQLFYRSVIIIVYITHTYLYLLIINSLDQYLN